MPGSRLLGEDDQSVKGLAVRAILGGGRKLRARGQSGEPMGLNSLRGRRFLWSDENHRLPCALQPDDG
jgi:hypothetical protein